MEDEGEGGDILCMEDDGDLTCFGEVVMNYEESTDIPLDEVSTEDEKEEEEAVPHDEEEELTPPTLDALTEEEDGGEEGGEGDIDFENILGEMELEVDLDDILTDLAPELEVHIETIRKTKEFLSMVTESIEKGKEEEASLLSEGENEHDSLDLDLELDLDFDMELELEGETDEKKNQISSKLLECTTAKRRARTPSMELKSLEDVDIGDYANKYSKVDNVNPVGYVPLVNGVNGPSSGSSSSSSNSLGSLGTPAELTQSIVNNTKTSLKEKALKSMEPQSHLYSTTKLVWNQTKNAQEEVFNWTDSRLSLREALIKKHGNDPFFGGLYEHQVEGLVWALERENEPKGRGCIIAYDPGLGKTSLALSLIRYSPPERNDPHYERSKTLVICPQKVVPEWIKECYRTGTTENPWRVFSPYVGIRDVRYSMNPRPNKKAILDIRYGNASDKNWMGFDSRSHYDVVLITYKRAQMMMSSKEKNFINDTKWKRVILDEGDFIRNYNKTSRLIAKINRGCSTVMTGTPINNGMEDLWAYYDFIGLFSFFKEGDPWAHVVRNRESWANTIRKDPDIASLEEKRLGIYMYKVTKDKLKTQGRELPPIKRYVCVQPMLDPREIHFYDSVFLELDKIDDAHKKGIGYTPTYKGAVWDDEKFEDQQPIASSSSSSSSSSTQEGRIPLGWLTEAGENNRNLISKGVKRPRGEMDGNAEIKEKEEEEDDSSEEDESLECEEKKKQKTSGANGKAKFSNVLAALQKAHMSCVSATVAFPGMKPESTVYSTNSTKMTVFRSLLSKEIKEGDKVVVFSQWHKSLQLAKRVTNEFTSGNYKECPDHLVGKKSLYMDGKTDAEEASEIIGEYSGDENTSFLFATTKASNCGLNIQSANVVIILDTTANPKYIEQCICRAWRLGQKRLVRCYTIVIDQTCDMNMYRRCKNKLMIARAVENDKSFKSIKADKDAMELTKADIQEMRNSRTRWMLNNYGSVDKKIRLDNVATLDKLCIYEETQYEAPKELTERDSSNSNNKNNKSNLCVARTVTTTTFKIGPDGRMMPVITTTTKPVSRVQAGPSMELIKLGGNRDITTLKPKSTPSFVPQIARPQPQSQTPRPAIAPKPMPMKAPLQMVPVHPTTTTPSSSDTSSKPRYNRYTSKHRDENKGPRTLPLDDRPHVLRNSFTFQSYAITGTKLVFLIECVPDSVENPDDYVRCLSRNLSVCIPMMNMDRFDIMDKGRSFGSVPRIRWDLPEKGKNLWKCVLTLKRSLKVCMMSSVDYERSKVRDNGMYLSGQLMLNGCDCYLLNMDDFDFETNYLMMQPGRINGMHSAFSFKDYFIKRPHDREWSQMVESLCY